MPQYSVKKPYTVLVGVLAVIMFGIISYMKMVPDLLPNMDFPYMIVITQKPGATPEEVEEQITKPMEQQMATLNNIKNLSSSSSQHVSVVMLEFEQDTNMDSTTVDILQKIQTIEGSWDDSVGTPMIMRINPSMLPVMVASVASDEMDRYELSKFTKDELIPALEGTTGLASIDTGGLVEQKLTVTLNEDKIKALNKRLEDTINDNLAEAQEKLDDAQNKIDGALNSINSAPWMMAGSMNLDVSGLFKTVEDSMTLLVTDIIPKQVRLGITKTDSQSIQNNKNLYTNAANELRQYPANTPLSSLTLSTDTAKLVSQSRYQNPTDANGNPITPTNTTAIKQAETDYNDAVAIDEFYNGSMKKAMAALSAGISGLLSGVLQMSSGQASLLIAKSQVDAAQAEIDKQIDAALKAADMFNVLTLETIGQIIGAQNFSMPAGYVYDENDNGIIVSVGDGIKTVEELENLPMFDMKLDGIEPVRLIEVADIIHSDNTGEVYATLDANNSIILTFSKQSNFATASVSQNLRKQFDKINEKYPHIHFIPLMDQGDYIYLIRDSIVSSLLWGALFSVLVLLVFLLDWRPTFITLLSIPISVLFAFTLMYFSGISINMMSLSGLSISVGMLVDNSVVVIENTYRLRSLGENSTRAAISGAAQVAGAIAASTLTTVCVFLPIVYVGGMARELFLDMVLALSFTLLASLVVALTVVPALTSVMLRKEKDHSGGLLEKLMPAYKNSVMWAVRHKAIVLIFAVALLIGSGIAVIAKGFTFMPDIEMNQITVALTPPENATFEEITQYSDEAARRMLTVEGVANVGGSFGESSGTDMLSMMSTGDGVTFYVLIDETKGHKAKQVARDIDALCADMPCEIKADSNGIMGAMMSSMTGDGVSVRLYGNDLNMLQKNADRVAEIMKKVEGVYEVSTGENDPTTELHFVVDKNKAIKEGLTVAQVYMQVAKALAGTADIIELTQDGTEYAVSVKVKDNSDLTREFIENCTIAEKEVEIEKEEKDNNTLSMSFEAPETETVKVKLKDVATLQETITPASILRASQRRYLDITGKVSDGYNVTKVTDKVEKVLSQMTLDEGFSLEYNGERENIITALTDMLLMLLAGIILVYLVMVGQFQSLKSPFIVMFTIPLAFTGGFLALLIADMEVNLLSMLGFVMLVGIIVNNGIVLVDYINQLRMNGMKRRAAIAEAAVTRLRPILMTSITTILGLVVMALGQNEATSFVQPLAVTCIGGLVYATLMTLYVVPVMYDMFSKKPIRKVEEEDLVVSQL